MLSGQAKAGPPIPFDSFTTNSGDIAASCSPSPYITCASLSDPTTVVSDGMIQRRVVVSGTGNPTLDGTYIQFIITEPGVTGDASASPFTAARGNLLFTNEDFIKMNNRQAGISSKQTIIESTTDAGNPNLENRFVNISEYEYGPWANSSGTSPWVKIQQEISQVDYTDYNASVDPQPTLVFSNSADIINNGNNFENNYKIGLSQMVDLTDAVGSGVQGFEYVRAKGQYQTSSNTINPLLPGGTNGGSVTWNVGDEVTAMWIGQFLEKGNLAGGPLSFGLTQYTAVDSSGFIPTEKQSRLISFSDTTAVNWNLLNLSIFGPPPTLPSTPVFVAPTYAAPAPDYIAPTIPVGSAPVGNTTPVTLPVAYYGWTVSGGVFSLDPCPLGVVCGQPIVNEGGVFQRQVTVGGVTYMQTIITDANATGNPNAPTFDVNGLAFKSENFVRINSTVGDQGIASTLDIAEEDLSYLSSNGNLPSTAGQFVYNTEIKTGWANGGPLDPRLSLSMRLLIPDNSIPEATTFEYKYGMLVGETEADKVINLSTTVGTTGAGIGSSNILNPIMFATSIVRGAFQNTTRTLSDPALLPSTGGTIAWNPYEAIQVTWIGGEYGVTPDPAGPSHVNTLSYTNLSKTATPSDPNRVSSTDTTPFNSVDPESWVNPFSQPSPTYSSTFIPDPF